MKKILFFLVALVCATVVRAQEQRASLTHGGDVKYYYGALGFHQAMEDAVDGDVIYLSGGLFYASDIYKAVTVRGAGIVGKDSTSVVGDFEFNVKTVSDYNAKLEGVRFQNIMYYAESHSCNSEFYKCGFGEVEGVFSDGRFINCDIALIDIRDRAKIQFFNSHIGWTGKSEESELSFVNCVVEGDFGGIHNSLFLNCVLNNTRDWPEDSRHLPSSTTAIHCVATSGLPAWGEWNGYAEEVFLNTSGYGNTEGLNDNSLVFESTQTFKLTEEAATKYLGTDGTQVGMYGGYYPYSPIVSYPRITKMDVSPEADADGMIKVEIEVSNPE